MYGLDFFTPCQICNRPRQFQDTMIGTRRQIELRHRHPYQTLIIRQAQYDAFILQFARLLYLPEAHIRIADYVRRAVV
jgi:hypothetical protein